RPEDNIVHTEQFIADFQILLDSQFCDAVGVFGLGDEFLGHREVVGSINGNRGSERKTFYIMVNAGIDEIDAANQVVGVVKAFDEVAQALGGIGGQMVDIIETVFLE